MKPRRRGFTHIVYANTRIHRFSSVRVVARKRKKRKKSTSTTTNTTKSDTEKTMISMAGTEIAERDRDLEAGKRKIKKNKRLFFVKKSLSQDRLIDEKEHLPIVETTPEECTRPIVTNRDAPKEGIYETFRRVELPWVGGSRQLY